MAEVTLPCISQASLRLVVSTLPAWGGVVGRDTPILLGSLAPLSSSGSRKRAKGLERRGQERKEL